MMDLFSFVLLLTTFYTTITMSSNRHQLVTRNIEKEILADIKRTIGNELLSMAAVNDLCMAIIIFPPGQIIPGITPVYTYANGPEGRLLIEQTKQQLSNVKALFVASTNEPSASTSEGVLNPKLVSYLESKNNHLLRMVVKDYISMYGSLPEKLSGCPDKMNNAELKSILRWYYSNSYNVTSHVVAYISIGEALPMKMVAENHNESQMPICWNPFSRLVRDNGPKQTKISKRFREIFYGEVDKRKSSEASKENGRKAAARLNNVVGGVERAHLKRKANEEEEVVKSPMHNVVDGKE
jgi:hypothetical protein